ncbi:MAG: hypothetical protein AMXMBFR84_31020 [Candidatus Hydrogenedentota bacterium]
MGTWERGQAKDLSTDFTDEHRFEEGEEGLAQRRGGAERELRMKNGCKQDVGNAFGSRHGLAIAWL